ncbi:MAG: hypothetical protein E7L00_07070 [Propionibacteriaceae bacterium]|nr:hypothetical protein [Propionibacteriaceae bacterium]
MQPQQPLSSTPVSTPTPPPQETLFAEPSEDVEPSKKPGGAWKMVLVAFIALALGGIGATAVWLLFGQDSGDEAAPQATKSEEPLSSSSSSPTEQSPSPNPSPSVNSSTSPEASPADDPSAPGNGTAVAQPQLGAEGAPPTQEQAMDAMEAYLAAVPGNPTAGLDYMTSRRQAAENLADYSDWWNSVASASLDRAGCRYVSEQGMLICPTTYVLKTGKATTSEGRWRFIVENGRAKLDVGVNDPRGLAELQQLHRESLATFSPNATLVAELSAKRDGIEDPLQTAANGSHRFFYADIAAYHRTMVERFPAENVLLLYSTEFEEDVSKDLWYTVVDGGFQSEAEVEQWCQSNFPGLQGDALRNQCAPRATR